MIGISLDLGGPAQVALYQNAVGTRPSRHRSCKKQRLARQKLLGLPNIRDDGFLSAASCMPSSPPAPATPPSVSGTSGDSPDRPIRAALGELVLHILLEIVRLGELSRLRQYAGPRAVKSSSDRVQVQLLTKSALSVASVAIGQSLDLVLRHQFWSRAPAGSRAADTPC